MKMRVNSRILLCDNFLVLSPLKITTNTTIFLTAIATAMTVVGAALSAVFAQPPNTSTQTKNDNTISGDNLNQTNTSTATQTGTLTVTGDGSQDLTIEGTQSQVVDQSLANSIMSTKIIRPS